MAQCLKCKLEFGDQIPEYCPVCQSLCYVCPWCGRMTDASQQQCSMLDCHRPIKYLRMTPDLRDIMRLRSGETVQVGNVEVTIDRALYASQRVTVYKGRVAQTNGKRKSEPARGDVVVVREVMDDYSPRVQSVVSKLIALRHPNVVRTFVGEPDPDRCCYYLLQSWVGDRTLASAYLQEEGGKEPGEAELAKIALALSKAVEYLHNNGIIHCDVTPFNVLLAADGTPVLADFGLACLADDSSHPTGFTPGYAPLEMYPAEEVPSGYPASGWSIGTHTDRYMLGTTIYSVACGTDGRSLHPLTKTPVIVPPTERARYDMGEGGSPQTPLAALRPKVDPRIASWVETLMSLSPEARFKTDGEMIKRIGSTAKSAGRRRRFHIPNLSRGRKPVKYTAIAACIFLVGSALRHSYSLAHAPDTVPSLIMADVQGMFGMRDSALNTLYSLPSTAEAGYRIGTALERSGKLEEALAAYNESRKIDPKYGAAKSAAAGARSRLGTTSLQRGLQLYRAKEYYLAYQQLIKAIHYGSCNMDGYVALAGISERRGDIEKAAMYYDIMSQIQPNAVRLHYKAAILHLDSGNLTKAYYHTSKARNLHISPKPSNDISDDDMQELLDEVTTTCLREANIDISKASNMTRIYDRIVWLNRANDLMPSPLVLAKLGRYYERLGDLSSGDRKINHYEQAVSYLRKAKNLHSGSATINNDLARCIKKRDRVS